MTPLGFSGDDEGVGCGDGDFGGAPFSGETVGSGDAGVGGTVVEFGAVGLGAGVGDAEGLAVGRESRSDWWRGRCRSVW